MVAAIANLQMNKICVDKNINQSGPTSIVQNISVVTARVDEVLFKDETDYQLKVTVLSCRRKKFLRQYCSSW